LTRCACILVAVLVACAPLRAAADEGDDEPTPSDAADSADDSKEDEDSLEVKTRAAPEPGQTDQAASREFVDGEQLRESTEPTVVESLATRVPGLHVTSRGAGVHGIAGGGTGGLSMRGLGGQPNTQVLVVQDGVPDYQGVFGHPMPDFYLPETVEFVEVVAGGDSVRYGTNAAGAVILIESAWPKEEGWQLDAGAGLGAFETTTGHAVFQNRSERVDVVASLSGRTTRGHRDGAGGQSAAATLASRHRTDEGHELNARLSWGRINGADPGPITHPYADRWYDAQRASASAGASFELEPTRLRLRAYLTGGQNRLYDGFVSRDVLAGAHAELDVPVGDRVQLLIGQAGESVDGVVQTIDGAIDVEPTRTTSTYLEVSAAPLEWLDLVAGARYVLGLESGGALVYKGGAVADLWRGARLRARLARNYRQPTIRERYLPFPVANSTLKPEFSLSQEVGFEQYLSDWTIRLTGFRTVATNLIRYFGVFPSAEVINIDRAVFWGGEGLVSWRPRDGLRLTLLGSVLDTERYTRQNPSQMGTFRVSWAPGPWSLSAHARYVGGLYGSNYQRDSLPDILRVDAQARYAFDGERLELFMQGRNLTDQRHAYLPGYPMPGLNVFGGVEVSIESTARD
jgi:iron complex outermembrane receptor protein